MTDTTSEITLAEKAEQLEERFALEELEALEAVKDAAQAKNRKALQAAVSQVGVFEHNLFNAHEEMLSHITVVCAAMPDHAATLTKLEKQIEVHVQTVVDVISAQGGSLWGFAMVRDVSWHLVLREVTRVENALKAWVALGLQVLEEFKVQKKEYSALLTSAQDRILGLLRGDHSQEKRTRVWNRWSRVITDRKFDNLNLKGANLAGFDLHEFKFFGKTNLKDANLQHANLTGVHLARNIISSADLSGVNLSGADLTGAVVWGVNLTGAKLVGAQMSNSTWKGSNLKEADLRGAMMEHASFQGVNFSGANLQNAYMVQTALWDALLEGADLKGANLREVQLSGADLKGAKNLTVEQFESRYSRDSPPKSLPSHLQQETP